MRYLLILSVLCIIILAACSGRDQLTVDKIPPLKPVILPHRGDLGDSLVIVNGYLVNLIDDENNGIDAVPDGNWIRVSWEYLPDTDLDYVKIFRFDEFNTVSVVIDSIISNNISYTDSRTQLDTHTRYSYFIEVVDNSGNSTISDTVSYVLLSKQLPSSPANGSVANPNNLVFSWQQSGAVGKFRLLVFDENNNYMWHDDIQVAFEGDFFDYNVNDNINLNAVRLKALLNSYTGNLVYWRVDAFTWDSELDFYIGSESYVQTLYISH